LQALELKLPPPLITGLTGFGMWLLCNQTPELTLLWRWHFEVACVLALTGGVFDISGALVFRKARTTINPLKPAKTSAMVTCGIYRYSRNPMYFGLLLILCGWAIYLSHPLAFLGLPAFVAYLNRFQIIPEERLLSEKFGAQYSAYRKSVRRWF